MFPSSHCSPHCESTWPSPHTFVLSVQSFLQASQLLVLPSSHCSPGCTTPSPHAPQVHCDEQCCPAGQVPRLPSQTSPVSSLPLPQVGGGGGPPHGVSAVFFVGTAVGSTVPVTTGCTVRYSRSLPPL